MSTLYPSGGKSTDDLAPIEDRPRKTLPPSSHPSFFMRFFRESVRPRPWETTADTRRAHRKGGRDGGRLATPCQASAIPDGGNVRAFFFAHPRVAERGSEGACLRITVRCGAKMSTGCGRLLGPLPQGPLSRGVGSPPVLLGPTPRSHAGSSTRSRWFRSPAWPRSSSVASERDACSHGSSEPERTRPPHVNTATGRLQRTRGIDPGSAP